MKKGGGARLRRPKKEKEEGINLGVMAPQKGGGRGGGSNSFPSAAAAVAKVAVSKVGEANAGKKIKPPHTVCGRPTSALLYCMPGEGGRQNEGEIGGGGSHK